MWLKVATTAGTGCLQTLLHGRRVCALGCPWVHCCCVQSDSPCVAFDRVLSVADRVHMCFAASLFISPSVCQLKDCE